MSQAAVSDRAATSGQRGEGRAGEAHQAHVVAPREWDETAAAKVRRRSRTPGRGSATTGRHRTSLGPCPTWWSSAAATTAWSAPRTSPRRGRSVTSSSAGHVVGGAAVTEEIYPGFKYSVCSYVVSLLRPEIIRDLELARHGLRSCRSTARSRRARTATSGGPTIPRTQARRDRAPLARDAEAYEDFTATMARDGGASSSRCSMIPPDPNALDLAALLDAARPRPRLPQLGPDGGCTC